MEATELDIMLEELETRVERLRSLYEQYFLGIEKIPPQVAQKDVDRRLYTLRREQIRNTARRFKLQTIIQRYNTFQQYWMRIMREIENGTYRRHVLRAERTVGVTNLLTPGERKRLGLPDPNLQPSPTEAEPPAAPSDAAAMPEPSELTAAGLARASNPRDVRAQIERDLGLMLGDELDDLDTKGHFELGKELDDPLLSSMPPPLRKRKVSTKPVARRSARPTDVSQQRRANQVSSQPLLADTAANASGQSKERRGLDSTDPNAPASQAPKTKRRSLRPSRTAPGSIGPTNPGGLRLPATSAVAGRGLPPLPKAGVPRGAPAKIPSRPIIAIEDKPAERSKDRERGGLEFGSSATTPNERPQFELARPPAAPQKLGDAVSPTPMTRNVQAPMPTDARPVIRPVQTSNGPLEPGNVRGAAPNPAVVLDRNQSPVRVAPDGLTAAASAGREAKSNERAVEDQLERQKIERQKIELLATKLRNARIQTNESAPVSVDALAKKLEATADELRKKHTGRRIDFDVVIKDGKAIVKPIVR